jgi:hypothetical protein
MAASRFVEEVSEIKEMKKYQSINQKLYLNTVKSTV